MLSLNLSKINPPLSPGEIDQLYKDLNPGFKDNEAAFLSFMRYISTINRYVAENSVAVSGDVFLDFLNRNPNVNKFIDETKSINFPKITEDGTLLLDRIVFNSQIFKTIDKKKLFKLLNPDKTDNKIFERMRCIFNNEIYYQFKAHELIKSNPSLSLIVPKILMRELFIFKNRGMDYFVLGMEYIDGVQHINDILTEQNYLEIYNKIKDIILALNAIGIYHNDLNRNNILAKIVDNKEIKIVFIDFGEARNVVAYDTPHGSVYFDQMFIDADEARREKKINYEVTPSFEKMLAWAEGREFRGGKLKKRKNKSKKRTNNKKSKRIKFSKKSKKSRSKRRK